MKRIALVLSLVVPSAALAHPGHGSTPPESWTHYLTEPVHVGLAAIALIAAAAAWRRLRRRARS
ncbi:MAG: hypothetical protein KF773_42355 [Deltaproteobacteria bacterium]|nr:hypothetical protein [Deltaproteobacteria bacterium]MCW5805533.1 hypothetical protein [Deltaproteobacteria bacterium]